MISIRTVYREQKEVFKLPNKTTKTIYNEMILLGLGKKTLRSTNNITLIGKYNYGTL